MSRLIQLGAMTFILALAGALVGCASYGPYARCASGGCTTDATITADVQALFNRYPALEPPNMIHVQTVDRVVYLTGLVDTPLERQIAESVALDATGVARVVNSIAVNNKG